MNPVVTLLLLLLAAVLGLEGVEQIAPGVVPFFKGFVLLAAFVGIISWRLHLPDALTRSIVSYIAGTVGVLGFWALLWPKVPIWETFGNSTAGTFGESIGGMQFTAAFLAASIGAYLNKSKKLGTMFLVGLAVTGMFAATARLQDVGKAVLPTAPSDSTSSSQAGWNFGGRFMEWIGAKKVPAVVFDTTGIAIPPHGEAEIISKQRWNSLNLTSETQNLMVGFRFPDEPLLHGGVLTKEDIRGNWETRFGPTRRVLVVKNLTQNPFPKQGTFVIIRHR